jgi:hypothetical protein
MRVTIIPDDTVVMIDGEPVEGVDMASMPSEIHAVQWYGDHGEIEFRDFRPHEQFTDFDVRFGGFVGLFAARKIAIKRAQAPNTYSDWDDALNDWSENPAKKAVYDIAQQVLTHKQYLTSTDWYYARLQETGTAVPADVVTARIAARAYIQEHDV